MGGGLRVQDVERSDARARMVERLRSAWNALEARWWLVPVAGAGAAVALCLAVAHQLGFPLDDAWIHQDFARTLATTGQFAFQPGRSGAGSTSPLWVVLLLAPQLMTQGSPPLWVMVGWSALLGGASLAGLGALAGLAARDVVRRTGGGTTVMRLAGVVAGVAVVTDWHLVWAAVSGMETDLFALATLGLLVAASRAMRPWALGLLAAATVAIRPEGALVAGLVALGSASAALRPLAGWRGAQPGVDLARVGQALWRWSRRWLLPFGMGAGIGLVPYVWLNAVATGRLLPSTYYAKAAFYGSGESLQIVAGYGVGVLEVLVVSSPGLVALGALSYSHWLLRRGRPAAVAGTARGNMRLHGDQAFPLVTLLCVWPLALVAAYGVHLPVVYQHARYQMPALPPLLALGAAGAAPLLAQAGRRPLALVGGIVLAGTSLLSLGRGAQIYAANVRYIDDFQVRTARWLQAHTPATAVVATHDVGAIGYFSRRRVLDMAGLIDPQVMPVLDDQAGLERYLMERHAAYVVMFVDWFPPPEILAHDLARRTVFTATAGEFPIGPDTRFVVYDTGW